MGKLSDDLPRKYWRIWSGQQGRMLAREMRKSHGTSETDVDARGHKDENKTKNRIDDILRAEKEKHCGYDLGELVLRSFANLDLDGVWEQQRDEWGLMDTAEDMLAGDEGQEFKRNGPRHSSSTCAKQDDNQVR